MPPRRRKPRPDASRCCFKDPSGRRCTRAGVGSPPLCHPHRLVMEDAATPRSALGDFLSDIFTGKKVDPQKAGAAAAEVFEAFLRGSAAADAGAGGRPPTWNGIPFPFGGNPPGGQRRAGAGPRQPPPLDDEAVKRLRARKLLGFTDKEPLTVEVIRKRQRELGKKFHPDLQPPDKRKAAGEKMAQVSGAAALLMDDLR